MASVNPIELTSAQGLQGLEILIQEVDKLVSLPDIYYRLEEAIVDPSATTDKIAELLRSDPDLCARMLRMANSAFYSFPTKIETIERAVSTIGLRQIRELVLVTSATITSTARVALQQLREKGHKIGLVKIRLFRPFPTAQIRDLLDPVSRLAIIDRNISLGREGIFCAEVKAALCNSPVKKQIQGYLAGIGGTDVDVDLIQRVVLDALAREDFVDRPIWMKED